MIELEAFAADCRVFGHVEIGDERMTDTLNVARELFIHDARFEALDDGHTVEVPEIAIDRDELCAVVATGSRGDPARRVRTHATRVEVVIGPYQVEGAVHGTPAADPLEAALRRAPWVPLTEVTVRYQDGGRILADEIATLVVNRPLATRFRAVGEPSVAFPWEAPRTARSTASRTVDLTGMTDTVPDHQESRAEDGPQTRAAEPPV